MTTLKQVINYIPLKTISGVSIVGKTALERKEFVSQVLGELELNRYK